VPPAATLELPHSTRDGLAGVGGADEPDRLLRAIRRGTGAAAWVPCLRAPSLQRACATPRRRRHAPQDEQDELEELLDVLAHRFLGTCFLRCIPAFSGQLPRVLHAAIPGATGNRVQPATPSPLKLIAGCPAPRQSGESWGGGGEGWCWCCACRLVLLNA
jgi:hypothetical protein